MRQPFKPRNILLRSEIQRDTAISLINSLPLDDARPLEIVVREQVKVRGLDQNGFYFLRLGEIADQAWFNGKQYSTDIWHAYAKRNILPDVVMLKDGSEVSKWIESPDGSLEVISTTLLEKGCFANYTKLVEAFGASLGVEYSANPRENFR